MTRNAVYDWIEDLRKHQASGDSRVRHWLETAEADDLISTIEEEIERERL